MSSRSRAGLTDAEYHALKDRLDELLERYKDLLFLGVWSFTVEYVVDRTMFDPGDLAKPPAYADVTTDWRYQSAHFRWNMVTISLMPDDQVEQMVIHELMHVHVNELRIPGWSLVVPEELRDRHHDAEERVVTGLTNMVNNVWATARHDQREYDEDDIDTAIEEGRADVVALLYARQLIDDEVSRYLQRRFHITEQTWNRAVANAIEHDLTRFGRPQPDLSIGGPTGGA